MPRHHYPDFRYLQRMALVAGNVIVENFKLGRIGYVFKDDGTALTQTDTAINDMVVEMITEDFPHIMVAGEEGAGAIQESEYFVVCDPVDGTMLFTAGIPLSTFCVSVVKNGLPVVAIIYDAFNDRMWHAEKGGGAWENDRRIAVSPHATIEKSAVMIGWSKNHAVRPLSGAMDSLREQNAVLMDMPGIAFFGGLVATGAIHATITAAKQIWEAPAMQLIIEEGGGKMTDIDGNALRYQMDVALNGHIASNGILHEKLLDTVNRKK